MTIIPKDAVIRLRFKLVNHNVLTRSDEAVGSNDGRILVDDGTAEFGIFESDV